MVLTQNQMVTTLALEDSFDMATARDVCGRDSRMRKGLKYRREAQRDARLLGRSTFELDTDPALKNDDNNDDSR
jgi:hypothetical protein